MRAERMPAWRGGNFVGADLVDLAAENGVAQDDAEARGASRMKSTTGQRDAGHA